MEILQTSLGPSGTGIFARDTMDGPRLRDQITRETRARSQNFHRTLRQRTHEGPSVWFRHDSIVENHDDAAIAFSANEAADSLTQFQDCFRQRVFSEGVATARFDIFQFRLDQGMIGNGER